MKEKIIGIGFMVLFALTSIGAQEFSGIKQINGAGIFCRVIGKGEPVIVIHGGPGLGHDYLLKYYSQLADHYQLIFYDQRGNGLSDEFNKDDKVTVDDFVEDLEGIRIEFGLKKINLIGTSWGALVAINYTVKYAQNVNKLLLLEPAPGSSEYLPAFLRKVKERLTEADAAELKALENDPKTMNDTERIKRILLIRFKSYYYDLKNYDPHELNYMDGVRVRKDLASGNMFGAYLSNYDLYEQMKNIICPLLVIHGEYDPVPTESIEKMKDYAKHAELHIIKNCGHFVFIEKGEEYFDLVNHFLNQ